MICTCGKCNYIFSSNSLSLTCPDCGSTLVREATLEEKDWYYDLQREKEINPLLLDKDSCKAG